MLRHRFILFAAIALFFVSLNVSLNLNAGQSGQELSRETPDRGRPRGGSTPRIGPDSQRLPVTDYDDRDKCGGAFIEPDDRSRGGAFIEPDERDGRGSDQDVLFSPRTQGIWKLMTVQQRSEIVAKTLSDLARYFKKTKGTIPAGLRVVEVAKLSQAIEHAFATSGRQSLSARQSSIVAEPLFQKVLAQNLRKFAAGCF